MRKIIVSMPFVGRLSLEVEAETEEEALEAFYNTVDGLDTEGADVQWNFYEHVIEGNVWCAEESSDVQFEGEIAKSDDDEIEDENDGELDEE